MYVRVNGQMFIAPVGSEYLGLDSDGAPVAYSPNGLVAKMLALPGVRNRPTPKEEDA